MCVIAINLGKEIPFHKFQSMWMVNQDGIGMMYIDGNKKICVENALVSNPKELKMFYDVVYLPIWEDKTNTNIVIHFRYATDGDINYDNIHPFLFTTNHGTYALMHNGVMPDKYRNYSVSDKYITSDTQNFVTDFLQGSDMDFDSYDIKKIIEEIGMNKLVILSPENMFIINGQLFKNGSDLDGNFYSNLNWEFGSRHFYKDKQYQFWKN